MKVAYIVPGFCANETDWCIPVLTNFIREVSRELEVVVFTPYPATGTTETLHGARVVYLREGASSGAARLLYWRALARHIRREHRRGSFDLIHAFWANEPGYLATRAADELRIPSIVSLAGGELADFADKEYGSQRTRRGRWLVRQALASATLITAGSPWMADKVKKRHQKKVISLPLGVDIAAFSPGPIRRGRRLLAAASLIPLKDYPTLLRAVAMARTEMPELELDIAGDGVERERLQHLAHEYGLYGSVRFYGNVPYEGMPDMFRQRDLLVHASHYEAEGMVVLEALATGMPVVSSEVGVAASLPSHLVHRVPPGDAEQMAQAILRSLATAEHAELAHDAGPRLVGRYFSTTAVTERFIDIYTQITQSEPSNAR